MVRKKSTTAAKGKATRSVARAKAGSKEASSRKNPPTKKIPRGGKRTPKKHSAQGIMTAQSVLVSLTPAMRKELHKTMKEDGGVNLRLEPTGEIKLGRILRAYPVVEPPN